MRVLCKNNKMSAVNILQVIDDTSTSHPNWLNNIVSLSTVMYNGNSFDSAKDNIFSSECFCLSFGGNIIGNNFSGWCRYNIFINNVTLNTFSGDLNNNTFSGTWFVTPLADTWFVTPLAETYNIALSRESALTAHSQVRQALRCSILDSAVIQRGHPMRG